MILVRECLVGAYGATCVEGLALHARAVAAWALARALECVARDAYVACRALEAEDLAVAWDE